MENEASRIRLKVYFLEWLVCINLGYQQIILGYQGCPGPGNYFVQKIAEKCFGRIILVDNLSKQRLGPDRTHDAPSAELLRTFFIRVRTRNFWDPDPDYKIIFGSRTTLVTKYNFLWITEPPYGILCLAWLEGWKTPPWPHAWGWCFIFKVRHTYRCIKKLIA